MDITLKRSGYMACEPCHSFGPMVHECFLFHLILSGSGFYEQGGQRHALHEGQGFLIWPGKMAYYEADDKDPWAYAWIGLKGRDVLPLFRGMGLSEDCLVYEPGTDERTQSARRRLLRDIPKCADTLTLRSVVAGDMLNFLTFAGSRSGAALTLSMQYCEKAMIYMRSHLDQGVTIEAVASFVGLSRSQLFRTFREVYGRPPRSMLALIRMEQAQDMLLNTSFRLEKIAEVCGYANESHFCVSFKRECGFSPTEYRNTQSAFLLDE